MTDRQKNLLSEIYSCFDQDQIPLLNALMVMVFRTGRKKGQEEKAMDLDDPVEKLIAMERRIQELEDQRSSLAEASRALLALCEDGVDFGQSSVFHEVTELRGLLEKLSK